MAKIVNGLADGILTSVVRAWDARGELDTDVAQLQQQTNGASSRAQKTKHILVAPGESFVLCVFA